MLKLILKMILGIVQIPLTILYFVLNLIGGVLSGAGWIAGIVVFMITGICWLFGQFDVWYQPIIGVVIAIALAIVPKKFTEAMGDLLLMTKSAINKV